MHDINFIEAVAERDIDLLLLEELHCSTNFRTWFAARAFADLAGANFVGAWHSVTHPHLGESDLILILEDNKRRAAILIENKIDAVAQPNQASRYQQRGLEGIEKELWTSFQTCMTAPQRYLDATSDAAHYDAHISYEDVRGWLAEHGADRDRSQYKARMLTEAIEQNRRGYRSTPHESITAFWFQYWELVEKEYPELQMRKPGLVPAGSDWPEFVNQELGEGRRIVHKWRRECVDLEFGSAGERVDQLKDGCGSNLPAEVDVVKTGKSASIRFRVPLVDRFGDFDAQLEAIREGLGRAMELLYLSQIITFGRDT